MNVYVATIRKGSGPLDTVAFVGNSRAQVLYAVMELYPDWDVVRLCREQQWDESDGAAADHAAAW